MGVVSGRRTVSPLLDPVATDDGLEQRHGDPLDAFQQDNQPDHRRDQRVDGELTDWRVENLAAGRKGVPDGQQDDQRSNRGDRLLIRS